MNNSHIVEYIEQNLIKGYSVEQIEQALLGQGWSAQDVSGALVKARENLAHNTSEPLVPPPPPKSSQINVDFKDLSVSQVLTYLGAIIVILAGLIYVGINWSEWNELARIFAVFLPMLVCFVAGATLFFNNEYKKQGIVFLVVSAVLFPLFLSVAFKEMHVFAEDYGKSFSLAVSLSSLILYIGFSILFRFPVWTFLYQGVGMVTYYFFLLYTGINDMFDWPVISWSFLILSTLYVYWAVWFDQKNRKEESEYSANIGLFVLVLSCWSIFVSSREYVYIPYILPMLGFGYFLFGVWLDRAGLVRKSLVVYLIGAGLIFLSLARLGVSGKIIEDILGNTDVSGQNMIGWSSIIVGMLYFIISWSATQLTRLYQINTRNLPAFFSFFGSFFVLGAIFFLGLDGKKFVYETLLLLSSLGFIFASIPARSQSFLYTGTGFLVMYIFSTGSEYFQNDVGWPIVLFVSGIVSMGIGVGMEKIRKVYFQNTIQS
jgi:hypothetical protein